MLNSLTFITGNSGKAEHLSKYLDMPILYKKVDLVEIQSLDLEEIVTHKVIEAYQYIQKPVLVDDTSLTIHVFGKLPGPFIKYFLQEIGRDGICDILQPFEDKSATAEVAIGLYDGEKVEIFRGEVPGKISEKPEGEGGFGWDAIFIPEGFEMPRAALEEKDYDNTSPRKRALQKLERNLKDT